MKSDLPDNRDDPAEFWEARYLTHRGEDGQIWSGRVNAAVERELAGVTPGTALELGCGEGADAIWLASQGWTVTAIDISANALAVGSERAALLGLGGRISWVQGDLSAWHPTEHFDLVTAAFLHSPVDLPRAEILRRATTAVAPGGRLLVVGHGEPPGDAPPAEHAHQALPTAEDVLASLTLGDDWVVETLGEVERTTQRRDGSTVDTTDTVLRVRRPR